MNANEMCWIHGEGQRLRPEDAFAFEEGAVLRIHRAPGTKGCDCQVEATDNTAAVKGLALLVIKLAEKMGVDVGHIVSLLAVILLQPVRKEGS